MDKIGSKQWESVVRRDLAAERDAGHGSAVAAELAAARAARLHANEDAEIGRRKLRPAAAPPKLLDAARTLTAAARAAVLAAADAGDTDQFHAACVAYAAAADFGRRAGSRPAA